MPVLPDWLSAFLVEFRDAGVAQAVRTNLESDQVLPAEAWEAFCAALREALGEARPSSSIGEAEALFDEACAPHALKGPSARVPAAVRTLNRVVTVEKFVAHYLSQGPIEYNTADRDGALREFFKAESPTTPRRSLPVFSFAPAGRPVWAFFPEPVEGAEVNPIEHARVAGSASRLYQLLGLPSMADGDEWVPPDQLINLRYPREEAGELRVPTTFSAGLNRHFKCCADPAAPYGQTCDVKTSEPGFPEVVHENLRRRATAEAWWLKDR
jgi:hypothetical protein